MHTNATLELLDAVTTDLGAKMRAFRDKTCLAFDTRKLTRELNARLRKQKQKIPTNRRAQTHSMTKSARLQNANAPLSQEAATSSGQLSNALPNTKVTAPGARPDVQPTVVSVSAKPLTRHPKTLNLNTYKHHALGDYSATIRKYGTTDSYSTEPVSLMCGSNLPRCVLIGYPAG
jgi:hypothetical protein